MNRESHFEAKVDHNVVKIFVSTLFLAQKVGKDTTFEVEEDSLTIRSLNESKSAYIAVEFSSEFFDSFHLRNRREPFVGRISSKLLCSVMRNLKSLKHLIISGDVDGADHLLTFQFTMQSGLVRSHRFHYMDCEILNAVFDESKCSYIKVRPKVLSQLFEHFYRSPEVIASASPTTFCVKSFHTPAASSSENLRYMNTGLNVKMRDFDVYDYRSELDQLDMIFCMKEVAAFVGYCEAIESGECDCFFSAGGRAMKYSSKQDLISTQLVLATIEYTAQGPPAPPGRQHQQQSGPKTSFEGVNGRFSGDANTEGGKFGRKDLVERGEEESPNDDDDAGDGKLEERLVDSEENPHMLRETRIRDQKEDGDIGENGGKPNAPLPATRNDDKRSAKESVRGAVSSASEGGVSTHSTMYSSADDGLLRTSKRPVSSKKSMHARKRLLEESSTDDD
eukprot:gene36909-44778_t